MRAAQRWQSGAMKPVASHRSAPLGRYTSRIPLSRPGDAPMTVPADLDQYLASQDARIQGELFAFLRIPSVSARSEHDPDPPLAADWIAQDMRAVGLTATVHPTAGLPSVVGEWRGAAPSAPAVLVYGHYDVQPAEPLE